METSDDRLVRELRDKRAQLFAQLDVRLELLVLLGRNRRHVDRILHRAADQVISQLFGDARADNVLRLLGRARDMRRGNHVGIAHQARIGGRLGFKYVEPGAGDVSAFDRRQQRLFVHQFAARAIHDANAFLRQRERFGIDQVRGFRRQRAMQADEVARLQNVFERQQSNILLGGEHFGNIGIERDDGHFQRLREARHFRSDRAEADQAQRLVAQFAAGEFLFLPLARFHRGVGLRRRMRHGQQQRHGVLGHADGVPAGRVHDQHAFARGGVEIHVVNTHAGAPDDDQALGGVEQFGGHFRRAAHQQGVRVADFVRDFALRLGKIHDLPGRIGLQNFDDVVGNAVCDKNFHGVFKCRNSIFAISI